MRADQSSAETRLSHARTGMPESAAGLRQRGRLEQRHEGAIAQRLNELAHRVELRGLAPRTLAEPASNSLRQLRRPALEQLHQPLQPHAVERRAIGDCHPHGLLLQGHEDLPREAILRLRQHRDQPEEVALKRDSRHPHKSPRNGRRRDGPSKGGVRQRQHDLLSYPEGRCIALRAEQRRLIGREAHRPALQRSGVAVERRLELRQQRCPVKVADRREVVARERHRHLGSQGRDLVLPSLRIIGHIEDLGEAHMKPHGEPLEPVGPEPVSKLLEQRRVRTERGELLRKGDDLLYAAVGGRLHITQPRHEGEQQPAAPLRIGLHHGVTIHLEPRCLKLHPRAWLGREERVQPRCNGRQPLGLRSRHPHCAIDETGNGLAVALVAGIGQRGDRRRKPGQPV